MAVKWLDFIRFYGVLEIDDLAPRMPTDFWHAGDNNAVHKVVA